MIRTLIVMTTYGQIFYSKENFFGRQAGETDISLTAGLISAIYNMTTETQQQKITELELEDDRSVFRELPGEKLFIITVDKRMDTDDADDMLDDLANRFSDQYGDMVMDGMILNDFEPTVDEVVEERLWYSTAPSELTVLDIIGFLAIIASFIFYPYWLLNGQKTIIDPLKNALSSGLSNLIIEAGIRAAFTLGPVIILYILSKISSIGLLFRFAVEFIRRPTRGGYAEQLPTWFVVFPIAIIGSIFSIVLNGKGTQYALTVQPWIEQLERNLVNSANETLLWEAVTFFLIFFVITWFVIFPVLIGALTGDLTPRWLKSSFVLMGYSTLIHLPTHIIGGVIFHNLVGFHVNNQTLFQIEARSLEYLFIITLPINLFLFIYYYYLAISLNQLVTKNKERYPVALVVSFFVIIGLQTVIAFIFFRSDLLYAPIF